MRFLLLAYYWPPAGGAGVQRWLRLSQELLALGHEVTVITTHNGDYPQTDPELVAEIPAGIRLIRTYTPTFGGFFRLLAGRRESIPFGTMQANRGDSPMKRAMLWVRRNLIVPDARVVWNPFAYSATLRELRKHSYDALITTGPPHSTHMVGHRLKKERNVPWIADFRDPWTSVVYIQTSPPWKPLLRVQQDMERRVCADADAVLTVSTAIAEELPDGPKHVLRNGFRAEEFEGLTYRPTDRFRIKYIGTLTEGRDLTPVLMAVESLCSQGLPISLSFIGLNPDTKTWKSLYPHLDCTVIPFLPHRQALAETVDAEVVVLLVNRYAGSRGFLTMKLFEYLGARTFVLGIGPTDCEAAQLLREYHAGIMLDYPDVVGIEAALKTRVALWQNGEDPRNRTDLTALESRMTAVKLMEIAQGIATQSGKRAKK